MWLVGIEINLGTGVGRLLLKTGLEELDEVFKRESIHIIDLLEILDVEVEFRSLKSKRLVHLPLLLKCGLDLGI